MSIETNIILVTSTENTEGIDAINSWFSRCKFTPLKSVMKSKDTHGENKELELELFNGTYKDLNLSAFLLIVSVSDWKNPEYTMIIITDGDGSPRMYDSNGQIRFAETIKPFKVFDFIKADVVVAKET
jgi:hypothetical protein